MKKLFLLCLCLISFKTMFGLSVNVTGTDKTGPSCNNGTIHVHINYDIITNAFKVRITGPGGYVNETCPVGLFQNFDVDVNNLSAGNYSIEVWRLGFLAPCSGPYDSYIAISFTINSPANFTATISHTDVTAPSTYGCANNGTLTISPNSLININANVYLNNNLYGSYGFNGSFTISNLPTGNYQVDLVSNCYNAITLSDVISATPCNTDLNPIVTPSDQGCNNGIISFSVLNSTNVAYYDITVSSIPSGNLVQTHLGSTAVNHTFYNLAPGSYWVTVYEHRPGALQCYCVSPSKVITVTETITAAPTVISIISASSPSCSDGSIIMSNNDVYSNLPSGNNTVSGTYNAGCTTLNYTESVVIPSMPCNQITSFQTVKNSAINCGTGVIHLELSANANNLIKLLRNGIEVQSLSNNGSDYYFENLEDGNYEVQVINLDQCSCSVSATTTVSALACSLAGTLTEYGNCKSIFTGYAENYCGNPAIKVYRGNNNNLEDTFNCGSVFDYTIFKNGNYTLVMTDDYGCSTSTQFNVNTITCTAPINLSFASMTNNRVKLMWDQNDCANGYILQYRLQNATAWTNLKLNTFKSYKVLTNIQTNTNYEWRIRTICSATTKSAFSSIQTFCSGPNCISRFNSDTKSSNATIDFMVVPNPASDHIKLNFDSDESLTGLLTISNQTGKTVYTKNNVTLSNDFTIDISNLPAGLYILNCISGNDNHTARFVKMD